MSELTLCNHCTLERMKQRREDMWGNPIEVIVEIVPLDHDMAGWTSARYADKDKPSAYFLELTDHCVC